MGPLALSCSMTQIHVRFAFRGTSVSRGSGVIQLTDGFMAVARAIWRSWRPTRGRLREMASLITTLRASFSSAPSLGLVCAPRKSVLRGCLCASQPTNSLSSSPAHKEREKDGR